MRDYFHPMNKHILKFDCNNDIEKIRFNHYIMRKVNKNKMNGDLPSGYFSITRRSASVDLNLAKSSVDKLVKYFEETEIIELVENGTRKNKCSVYRYLIPENLKTQNKPKIETIDATIKLSEFKDFNDAIKTEDNPIGETSNETSKKDNLNTYIKIYTSVIGYLNNKAKKNFKPNTKKTMSLIRARLNEGFIEEEFFKVIDTKCKQWLNTNMEKFLRPETLFSNKFEGYLNEEYIQKNNLDNIEPWSVEFEF
ncbi:conserved phage C-terminal domain-containing protein [Faecalimicrobium sp. JNUCC 81]